MRARPFVVAIDGPAASGKGTLARRIAERFALAHLDTGALYRATAFLVLDQAGDPGDPIIAAGAARHVDHRIAMAFLVLGLATRLPVRIDDAAPIATSFPGFVGLMTRLGGVIREAR